MDWIALQPSQDEDATAWGWRALQFTPRVAFVDEALLLEVGASERLFGGRRRLLRRLLKEGGLSTIPWATGPSAVVALSLLRLQRAGRVLPTDIPEGLPLDTFTAAQDHLGLLERIGCTTLGQLHALPRAGIARRFGDALLEAMDTAFGQRPERYPWLSLPATFDQNLELPALATTAGDLMFAAQHLLGRLQAWLQGRNLGALALELEWTLDLRRLDGKLLPPSEKLAIRTAQPTQDMRHLRRLAAEQLARATIAAPANHLRLRTLQVVPWGGRTTSLLPEDQKPGEKLHELVERLSVRLGEGNVTIVQARQDHRPEAMQEWLPASQAGTAGATPWMAGSVRVGWVAEGTPAMCGSAGGAARTQPTGPSFPRDKHDILLPPWLLREPVSLQVKGDKPWYQGPLQLLTRARRIEAAWWDPQSPAPVLRDYFIARSEKAGLLWIYRERLNAEQDSARWFLHGLYA